MEEKTERELIEKLNQISYDVEHIKQLMDAIAYNLLDKENQTHVQERLSGTYIDEEATRNQGIALIERVKGEPLASALKKLLYSQK